MTASRNSGATLLIKSIEQMADGTAKRKPQDASGRNIRAASEKRNRENQLE